MALKNEKYLLVPCGGLKILGIPKKHLYQVKDSKTREELGWITENDAINEYGKENCYFSPSHTSCPICNAYLKQKIIFNVIKDSI